MLLVVIACVSNAPLVALHIVVPKISWPDFVELIDCIYLTAAFSGLFTAIWVYVGGLALLRFCDCSLRLICTADLVILRCQNLLLTKGLHPWHIGCFGHISVCAACESCRGGGCRVAGGYCKKSADISTG